MSWSPWLSATCKPSYHTSSTLTLSASSASPRTFLHFAHPKTTLPSGHCPSCLLFFKTTWYQLLHLEWISNEVLLYSSGNYIQSLGIEHDRRQYGKKNVYIDIYDPVTMLYGRNGHNRVPIVAQQVRNPTSIHEDAGLIPSLAQWVKGSGIATSCSIGCR